MKHSKKKKRSRPPNQVGVKGDDHGEESEEQRALKSLMEAFTSVSIEVAASAYREANGDLNKAAGIIGGLEEITEDQATSCSSSSGTARSSLGSGSGSGSSEVFMDPNCGQIGFHGKGFRGNKQKKLVAATGTVSSVLGKDYVTTSIRKDSSKRKGYAHVPASKEDAERFLCSMLGDNCELSVAVVRDVLGQCGCDIEKALNALLEFSASSCDWPKNGQACEHATNNKEDTQFLIEVSDNLTEGASDSTSHTSESEIQDNVWSMGYHRRNYSEVLTSSGGRPHLGHGNLESELPQKVLETLFNMPKNTEHEPHTMNWKDVVRKIESLGQRFEYDPADGAKPEHFHAKGDGYEVHRKAASQHWDMMKSYYQKAATAFSNGERGYAAHLSEKGRIYNKMAREADEKASQEIFKARNKSIENVITIDLHGQHVKQAIRLLKAHLLFGAYVRSVQIFRVITGCGSHGVGKSKLKQSVINLVEREGIEWSEENRGTVLIRLDGQREFTFVDSDSDDE